MLNHDDHWLSLLLLLLLLSSLLRWLRYIITSIINMVKCSCHLIINMVMLREVERDGEWGVVVVVAGGGGRRGRGEDEGGCQIKPGTCSICKRSVPTTTTTITLSSYHITLYSFTIFLTANSMPTLKLTLLWVGL